MCLCKGSGKVVFEDKGVIQWHSCPDSDCTFDSKQAEERYNKFKQDVKEWKERAESEGFAYAT